MTFKGMQSWKESFCRYLKTPEGKKFIKELADSFLSKSGRPVKRKLKEKATK
jgi:hypothetical protein